MEPARPQAPPEITISSSPRSSSFFDRVLRRTSTGPSSTSRIPTLNLPAEPIASASSSVTAVNASSRPHSRSSSRSSHKRQQLTIDTSIASYSQTSNKKSKSTHLTVVETSTRSSSRSRSRSRSSRSPSPGIEMINSSSRVASINHVGRHTNDWLFGGFHLTSKIGAQRGRRTK
ncbi:hypothetical protein Dda_1166 [Drechslerella dactyloides]|uniref:Uncharacterized protein n=1 Tax=Drechslerella dactyloides TaxID=74499 RepID=A0AAD6J6G1_DREDA|nr:hypothetical protein Dda_1166 [Drechslerella dactyloides]